MRHIALLSILTLGCSPATITADAAPARQTAKAPQHAPSTGLSLGELAGTTITLKDLDPKDQGPLIRQDAKSALERWKVLRSLAQQAALGKALDLAAQKEGINASQLMEKMKKMVPMNPITPEIIDAIHMSNKAHFKGQSAEAIKTIITERLTLDFQRAQEEEIKGLLLKRYGFSLKVPLPALPQFKVDAAHAPALGPKTAAVTVAIFSDFQCPACAQQANMNEALAAHYGTKVRWVYRHYPLSFHDQAPALAHASICAHEQKAFWPFHNRLFQERSGYDEEALIEHAKASGVADLTAFKACLADASKADLIAQDKAAGDAAYIQGTPALFIDGRPLYGMVSPAEFQALINGALQGAGVTPPEPLQAR
jgi:protein-disulfide isomerase